MGSSACCLHKLRMFGHLPKNTRPVYREEGKAPS